MYETGAFLRQMITGIIMEMVAIMTGGLTETMVWMLKKTQTQMVIHIM